MIINNPPVRSFAAPSNTIDTASASAPVFELRPRDPRLADCLENYPHSLLADRLYQSIDLMERYSIDLSIELLDRLDVFSQLDRWQSASNLCDALSVQSNFQTALAWLLERVIETGIVEAGAENETRIYRLRRAPWQPDVARLRELGIQIDRGNAATFDLLDYAANAYPTIARGEQTGEGALFGPAGISLWTSYFHNANPTYAMNNWIGAVAAADRIANKSKLRILEIGVGCGSATEILLQWMRERDLLSRLECYRVTEPNAFFRRRAERELLQQFGDVPLEFGSLDINLPWRDQGVQPAEFDLIYGVNVVHVATDLFFTLGQAREALASGGSLVIGECVRPRDNQIIYAEMVFQILQSFANVKIDNEFRPNPGFLTAAQWRGIFAHAGFDGIEVAPDIERIRDFCPNFFTAAIAGKRAG